MTQAVVVRPDPQRVVEGLRDTGYEFHTAIADLIDNSIAAKATLVDVRIKMDMAGEIRVSIADNGMGMDHNALLEAMRYGSPRRPDPRSLGKFGLGLKTASTAFCRKLTVVSTHVPSGRLSAATWDLDHIAAVGEWELLLGEPDTAARVHLTNVAGDGPGTVVIWQSVDRLLKDYQQPSGTAAQKALRKQTEALREHLGMVYQRFLDPDDDRANFVEIKLNGDQVHAWDPFSIPESEVVAEEDVPVELGDNNEAMFKVRAHVLPRREEFSSDDRAREAKLTNDRQGIYIYREERLIHAADWLGIFQKEPHGTLLRVEFSFDHELDAAFHIDIKKSKILLNEELWNWLADEFLPAPRRAANERYRKGQKKRLFAQAQTSHAESNAAIGAKEGELDTPEVRVIDPRTGDVEVQNPQGRTRMKLKIGSPLRPAECYVQPKENLDDGVLWEPAIIGGHKAVMINTGHPYYSKVYVPNLSSGVTVQGMDSLLWALCMAELMAVSPATQQHFGDLRFMVFAIPSTTG